MLPSLPAAAAIYRPPTLDSVALTNHAGGVPGAGDHSYDISGTVTGPYIGYTFDFYTNFDSGGWSLLASGQSSPTYASWVQVGWYDETGKPDHTWQGRIVMKDPGGTTVATVDSSTSTHNADNTIY